MVCYDQWNPLVATSTSLWGESIFSPDVRCSIDLVLDKGEFIAMMYIGGRFSAQRTAS